MRTIARRRPGTGRRRASGAGYVLTEGWRGLTRNGLMTAAAVVVTLVTLLALGGALVVATILQHVTGGLEREVQVAVYADRRASSADLADLGRRLRRLPGVTAVEYVSRERALARLQERLGGRINLRDVLARNPLPASFVVTAERPEQIQALAAAARRLPHVLDVRSGEETVPRLLALTRSVRAAGAAGSVGLALVALVVVGGTIRLTVLARRAEIEVMRLVGATAWFIRWPFVVEGALIGTCAACAALLLVVAAYLWLAGSARAAVPFVSLPDPGTVALAVSWRLLAWGLAIGVTASLLAVRRHVRV